MDEGELREGLYERASELARLSGRLGEAEGGAGGLTVIEGPAGIGKTSLLERACAQAQERGMRVLAGRGAELERGFAFGVFRQALERPLSELDERRRALVLTGHAALAEPLLDSSRSAASPEALLHGLYWLLANLAEQHPLVLAIDDAHWADESSIGALAYLARRAQQLPLAIVIATRPPPVDAGGALSALVTDPTAERLLPSPLSEDAVAKVSASDDPSFVRATARATGGNPFLLDQLLRELGPDRSAAAVARVEPRDLGRHVLARLGDDARAFAWALAILGQQATVAECAALAELGAAEGAVEELIAAGVLADERGLRFRHPLIEAAVDAGLPPQRRASWHARAAALLRNDGADVERVAVHLAAGAPSGSAEVVDVLTSAAERALARGAPTSAAPLLRRALAEPPEPARRPQILLTLGEALTVGGDAEAADAFAEAGRTSADLQVTARALEARAWWWGIVPGGVESDLADVDALLASIPAEDGDLRARVEAVRLTFASRSAPAMDAAMARAERLGLLGADASQHPDLLAAAALWRLQNGHPASVCVDDAQRAVAAAAAHQRLALAGIWFPFAVSVLAAGERFAEAVEQTRAVRQDCVELGSPTWFALTNDLLAWLLAETGELVEAEAEAVAAFDASRGGGSWMAARPAGRLADVLLRRGRVADAERAFGRLGMDTEIPDQRPLDELLVVRARLRQAEARRDEALADVREALRRYGVRGPASINEQAARLLMARLEHATGDHEGARERAAEATQIAERWGTSGAIGAALHTGGAIEADIELLEAAVARLSGSPLRLAHAAALADLGALLRRRGARRDSREPLRAAHEIARECGADGLMVRAGDELAASGATVPTRPRSGADALTPSEQRIAHLAADGATNKEIAQELFLSVKTIEMHLGNTYRKLDIASRRELPISLAPSSPGHG